MTTNPVLSYAWKRWNRLEMTWHEAVAEAAEVFHLAVKLDEVRRLRDERNAKKTRSQHGQAN